MNPMFDRYYMNPKALVRDKESGASARVQAKSKRKGGSIKPGKEMTYKKGGSLKQVPSGNKGLPKLPKSVRNKMGYMKHGGSKKIPVYTMGGQRVPGMFKKPGNSTY